MSSIHLKKGETIHLDRYRFDLSAVTIGLGWDIRRERLTEKWMQKLLKRPKAADYDLDVTAFVLDQHNKVKTLGRTILKEAKEVPFIDSDIIYFNNLTHSGGNIIHTGDNLTGAGDGDDEQIIVKLHNLDEKYVKVLFLATIYKGQERNQHFGMIENAFIRAVDANGKEMTRYQLNHDKAFIDKCCVIFAEVYRKGIEWKFRALGNAYKSDSFIEILKNYV